MSNSTKGGRIVLFWMWRSLGVVIDTNVFTRVRGMKPPENKPCFDQFQFQAMDPPSNKRPQVDYGVPKMAKRCFVNLSKVKRSKT